MRPLEHQGTLMAVMAIATLAGNAIEARLAGGEIPPPPPCWGVGRYRGLAQDIFAVRSGTAACFAKELRRGGNW